MCDFILDCKTETALVSFLWVFLLFFFFKTQNHVIYLPSGPSGSCLLDIGSQHAQNKAVSFQLVIFSSVLY